jgi:hypothetical protein
MQPHYGSTHTRPPGRLRATLVLCVFVAVWISLLGSHAHACHEPQWQGADVCWYDQSDDCHVIAVYVSGQLPHEDPKVEGPDCR